MQPEQPLTELRPKTKEDYIQCVRWLAGMLSESLQEVLANTSDAHNRERALQNIASGVQTIANLRGDNGWDAIRPEGLVEYQKEMYRLENELRAQLEAAGYTYPTTS